MSAPKRIQLRRTKGWRKPEGAVVVARPTRWGNPFKVGEEADADNQAHAAELYKEWIEYDSSWVFDPYGGAAYREALTVRREWILAHLPDLAGKDLACWCRLVDADGTPVPCHADVLLAFAAEVQP